MPQHQTVAHTTPFHVSTNGCLVDHARWVRRTEEAADLVRRRFLTLNEASEQFAVPAEEILAIH